MFLPLLGLLAQPKLDAILDAPQLSGASVAAVVSDLNGNVLYQRNGSLRLVPASNQKLLSVAFALHVLGPGYRPSTKFWRLEDRIVVDAPGDPSMTLPKLQEAARKLNGRPDTPVFARQAYRVGVPATWEHDDLPHRYAPRITALTLEGGSFRVVAEDGVPKLEPAEFGIRLFHFPSGARSQTFDPFGNVLVVRGELPKPRTVLEAFAIPEPDRAAASMLGGRLHATQSVPRQDPDHEVLGVDVGTLAKSCLVPSDNFIAENLFLVAAGKLESLGEDPYGVASRRMRRFLVDVVKCDANDFRVYDGSGMSRHNLVTARGIAKLLVWALGQPFGTLWTESLAAPGSGTLRTRLAGSTFRGKTGSLDMVSSLSGYVRSQGGREYVVSLLMNGFLVEASAIRDLQDRFVREIETGALDGMVFDSTPQRARSLPHSNFGAPDVGRVPRPAADRDLARPGPSRRAQSSDEAPHREKRVAVLRR